MREPPGEQSQPGRETDTASVHAIMARELGPGRAQGAAAASSQEGGIPCPIWSDRNGSSASACRQSCWSSGVGGADGARRAGRRATRTGSVLHLHRENSAREHRSGHRSEEPGHALSRCRLSTLVSAVQLLYRSTGQLGQPTVNVTSILLPAADFGPAWCSPTSPSTTRSTATTSRRTRSRAGLRSVA